MNRVFPTGYALNKPVILRNILLLPTYFTNTIPDGKTRPDKRSGVAFGKGTNPSRLEALDRDTIGPAGSKSPPRGFGLLTEMAVRKGT